MGLVGGVRRPAPNSDVLGVAQHIEQAADFLGQLVAGNLHPSPAAGAGSGRSQNRHFLPAGDLFQPAQGLAIGLLVGTERGKRIDDHQPHVPVTAESVFEVHEVFVKDRLPVPDRLTFLSQSVVFADFVKEINVPGCARIFRLSSARISRPGSARVS
ncbi:MAG TPA: hypothetical protein VG457_14490 [Planctomycetota bacterium]|nr:hypothetical protein [Planctomycetota bacterium]